MHIVDKDGNKKYNTDDHFVLGSATPKWSGSSYNNFTYKGFDLGVLLTVTSCSLDEYNPSGKTPDNEWTSAAGFQKKITDCSESDITEDFLLDEYAREMIGEWNRWMTLKRFRAFETRLPKGNPQIKEGSFKKEYYLRPIPDAAILLIDNGAEYQNPGF